MYIILGTVLGLVVLDNLLGLHNKDINEIDQEINDELKIVW